MQKKYGNDWYPKLPCCLCNNIWIDYVIVFRLEQDARSLITPMGLAHSLHPIRSRLRNKRRNLWDGWHVSSLQPWFWSVYSIYYHIHTMYYSCILCNWNKLFLRDRCIPSVGVAMTVYWMIWYYYSFLLGFKLYVYLYCIVNDFLYHNMDTGTMWHCTLVRCTPSLSVLDCSNSSALAMELLQSCTNIGLVLGYALFCCSSYWFLDRDLFHHDSCEYYWDFMVILFVLNYTFRPSVTK